jgi:hypothetical protein
MSTASRSRIPWPRIGVFAVAVVALPDDMMSDKVGATWVALAGDAGRGRPCWPRPGPLWGLQGAGLCVYLTDDPPRKSAGKQMTPAVGQ